MGGAIRSVTNSTTALAVLAGAIAVWTAGLAQANDLGAAKIIFTETKFENGLTVLVHEDHRRSNVAVDVYYGVGSNQDPPGRSGFAHLFEHLMIQGSRHVPEDTGFKLLEEAGATDRNAQTGDAFTRYHEVVPSNELELALWLESDRMAFFLDNLDERTFSNQRDVVKNERRQTFENRPYGYWLMILCENIFPDAHPYHRNTIGEPANLDAATLAEARSFFQTWYTAGSATLVIAGNVDRNAALGLAKKYFGPIVSHPVPPQPTPAPVRLSGESRVEVEAGVEQAAVYVGWPTPAIYQDGDADLDLAALVLAGGDSGRLYRRLVHDLAIAQSVNAWEDSRKLSSIFSIEVKVRPGHTTGEVLRVIDEEIARIANSGVTSEELERARDRTIAGRIFDLESELIRAHLAAGYELYTGDPNYLAKDLERYERATAASLQQAVVRHLPIGRRVVEMVTPVKGAPLAGKVRSKTGSSVP